MEGRRCISPSNCILVYNFYPLSFVLWSSISRVIGENHVKSEQKYIIKE